MLSPADFHEYQRRGIEYGLSKPRTALWLFMSAGKTVMSLSIIAARFDRLECYGALILAPKLVAETVWKQEAQKWEHLQHLEIRILRGLEHNRISDLHRPGIHIHVINYEMIPWLVRAVNTEFLARGKRPPWNMLILDEVDRFRDSQGKRFSSFENLLIPPGHKQKNIYAPDPDAPTYFPYRITQTGTPASNGLHDLHGQYRVLDGGKRLYWFLGDFRKMFCVNQGQQEHNNFKVSTEPARQEILRRVSDITLCLEAEDYIKLPDYLYHEHWVDLPLKVQTAYNTLEKELFAHLDRHEDDPQDGGWMLEVNSKPGARTKCRQLANGAVIAPEGEVLVHDAKLLMLDHILHEANGKPVLLSYMFRLDMERILQRYKKQGYSVAYIGPGAKNVIEIVDKWNRGDYSLLVSHPLSIGHGMNLQDGGNEIVWFGLTDSPRLWLQWNARLRRQGQQADSVHVRSILARNTLDEVMVKNLQLKEEDEVKSRKLLNEYRQKKGL